ncbi:hypothetical protein [Flavobacterium branchiophilum]|uniref:hypothetical protein n=1 Tax=Flavobacterium branchiophilum TaxID=55197 RepID=UPI0002E3104E|nr:hypothetical protein [Flavobacterium branchiophilum]
MSSRRYTKDSNGNITSESLNYFSPKNDTDLFNRAESEPLRMGELTIYAHGNQHGFANINLLANSNLIVKKLYTDSVMYRNFKNGQTKNLTMNIKPCTTGETSYGRNIANILSIPHGITIYAAAGYVFPSGMSGYHSGGVFHNLGYNKFQDGKYKYNVSNQ